VLMLVLEFNIDRIEHEHEHEHEQEQEHEHERARAETICDLRWPGYFSGPRTPDGIATICTPGLPSGPNQRMRSRRS
jgi:hypothetical protein